jgi:hypothetical protein
MAERVVHLRVSGTDEAELDRYLGLVNDQGAYLVPVGHEPVQPGGDAILVDRGSLTVEGVTRTISGGFVGPDGKERFQPGRSPRIKSVRPGAGGFFSLIANEPLRTGIRLARGCARAWCR